MSTTPRMPSPPDVEAQRVVNNSQLEGTKEHLLEGNPETQSSGMCARRMTSPILSYIF
jgi:hypothetical protein